MPMQELCPCCKQPLPVGMTRHQLCVKLKQEQDAATQKAAAAAALAERQRMQAEFADKEKQIREKADENVAKSFDKKLKQATEDAQRNAERQVKGKVADLERQIKDANKDHAAEIRQIKTDTAAEVRADEQRRHSEESQRLKVMLEKAQRELQQERAGTLGARGERDLREVLEEAKNTFWQGDDVDRTRPGKKGSDLFYVVKDGGREVGRICFENKNTPDWQADWIKQAKQQRNEHKTPYVIIVTPAQPTEPGRDTCTKLGIPIVKLNSVVALVSILRNQILEIAKLRLSKNGADSKAKELLTYIVGAEFQRGFSGIEACATDLANHQRKERTAHENHWKEETRLHELIGEHHRTLNASLLVILKKGPGKITVIQSESFAAD